MELGVLGPLQVRQDGTPVTIPGAKPRAILTMLGLHSGSVVSADTLIELLWGDDPPRTAAKALQTHISSLRRTLGDGFVLTQGAGWIVAAAAVDVTRYKLAARTGREAAAGGDFSQAVARFEEALALWRGVPELPDGRRGLSEKTRWIEGHAALVEDRADALLATGRAAEVIGDLEAAVAEAPLRERRWGQLMLALYRAGRQGEALGAYQRARALLADELGVDPGPELRRLEAAIVAQDASLDIPVAQNLSSVTRAVTFLLTDIEGSTAAWEADADAMATALARHDELVEQVVTARGGRLIKTRGEGDATFSVFERPSAAAAAAIEMQEAIGREPWALREPLRIRVALHTGEVELRDGDYFGRAVNRAARLRSLAEGGQILCSGATAELVIDSLSDDVDLTDLGMRQLKNLARPEHVFELRLRPLESPVDSPQSETSEAPMQRPAFPPVLSGPGPFVGRGDELGRLLSAWQAALAGGVRTVLIAGEPGVGKTRLAGEWSQQAYEQGAVVLYGRCDEDLGAPYQPFAEALRALVPCMGADRLRGLRGVEALLPLVPGLPDVVPDLATPARADPDTERYALFDAVVALLDIASSGAPIVLILDDLHWAAKPTLLLLRHMLRFGDRARVQIVGTYRSTDLDRSHPLAAMLADLHRDGTAYRLTLSGLDQDDVTAYVAEAGYDDAELAHALASVTGGNPFFLIEALRHVDESGGVWDQSTLPQGVREAVSRRLTRLPAETNKALAAAAVVGSRFALELVEQVVGNDLIDAFDEACQAGIVIEEAGGHYRFNHAIVRQSLLAELASVRRMRLHQRIAATLETQPGADDELLAELAHHYFECAWAGNAAKAVLYCRRAADQAMARLAYEGAADLYDHALHALEELDEDLPDRDDQVAELLIARCEALLAAADVTSAASAVTQLQEATVDSARLAAWATCFDGQVSVLIHPERLEEVEVALAAAADRLAALDDDAGEANAHTVRATCLGRLGRIAECEVALDDALTAARRAREYRRVNAVLAGAPLAALWGPNPVPRAGGRCLDVVRLLRITTDSPAVEATSTRCQAVLEAFRGRDAAARRMIDSARRTVTELGLRHALLEVEQFAGIVELVADDPVAAEPHLRQAYNGFRRMGLDADTAETAALLGRTCLALGREDEADELCSESERLAGHALKASIAWRTLRAKLLSSRGDHAEARRAAEAAVSLAGHTDALVDHGDACLVLATVLGAAGDMTGARAAAERAVGLYERKGAATLAEKARRVVGERTVMVPRPAPEAPPVVELENECVRTGNRVLAAIDRGAWDEVERLFAPDIFVESHRKIVGFTQLDVPAEEWPHVHRRVAESAPLRAKQIIVAVRGERLALARLVLTDADTSPGAPRDELLNIYGIDKDGRIALQVFFDVEDMDTALAELDAAHARLEEEQSGPRRLENAASRVDKRLHGYFADRDWEAAADALAEDMLYHDRRRVANAGLRHGRDAEIVNARVLADLGASVTSTVIATRGERLVLTRARFTGTDQGPDAFHNVMLSLVEIGSDERVLSRVVFDAEDFDVALEELDARYLAGEAAAHAHTWSAISRTYAAFNRHELPPTTPNWVNVDHRRGRSFASGDTNAYLQATWDLAPDINIYIEVVEQLNDFGGVLTHAAHGTSRGGFDAEWRETTVLTVDGELINRSEVFDEADVNAALARFYELTRPARRLENTASRIADRVMAHFTNREWDAETELLADDFSSDDRRRTVNAGLRRGRDAAIKDAHANAGVGATEVTSTVIATRGERLVLRRARYSESALGPEPFYVDALSIYEINGDGRIVASVTFDPDDIDAAFKELDSRYLTGEAAANAHTWSLVASVYAAFNRRELFATTPDWVNLDHRRGAAFAPGDMIAYIQAAWEDSPDTKIYIAEVHRLSSVGAVVTHVAHGMSQAGFGAEWRDIHLLAVEGDVLSRSELFDETDLDTAIETFEQLSRPTCRPENAASRANERFLASFAARDWTAMADILAEQLSSDDRRRVVNAGLQQGRDVLIGNFRSAADLGVTDKTVDAIATRGECLVLTHARYSRSDKESDAFEVELLQIVESDADGLITALVTFDPDDFDAAIEELEARYLAGEAAAHAHTWSVITRGCAALNRREPMPTTPDWENIDHRRGIAFPPGDLTAYVRTAWDLLSNGGVYIETAHRVSDFGGVFTWAGYGTSEEGLDVEFRGINVVTVEGDLTNRIEIFDETDLDAAIARFEELSGSVHRLVNAASQRGERYLACIASGEWEAMAEMLSETFSTDDRRRVVGAGIRHGRDAHVADMRVIANLSSMDMASAVVAIRGERLALLRAKFSGLAKSEAFLTEVLVIVETGPGGQIVGIVTFDLGDFDAAVEELEARYLAGEASAYAHTWSVMKDGFAATNRHELTQIAPDCVSIDHRRGAAYGPGELVDYVRAGWELGQNIRTYVEVVHRLNEVGVVCTHAAQGLSREGFDAEWRGVDLLMLDGDMVNRCELFDETDLKVAIARFEELSWPTPRLENPASRVYERYLASFADRDWDAMAELLAHDLSTDDRRRVVNAGLRRGRDVEILDKRALAELGVTSMTSEVIAIRGKSLALSRVGSRAFQTEVLNIVEINADERIVAVVGLDLDDIDAAFMELDARYQVGEAATHAHLWSTMTRAISALNRREMLPTTPDWVNIDHRRHGTSFAPGELPALLDLWKLAPEASSAIEVVHRLNNVGGVVTSVSRETSRDGVNADWRAISVLTVKGDLIDRLEIFDEADLDLALAHFDQLSRPAARLENAASQVAQRFSTYFADRDWDALAAVLADNYSGDDRRRVVGAGLRHGRDNQIAAMQTPADLWVTSFTSTVMATRGERLALMRGHMSDPAQLPEAFVTELLGLFEIDADQRIVALISFDLDDVDAAFKELDARYLAGEAAAHAHTWSVIARNCVAFNTHELPATTPDWVNIDHRRGALFAPEILASGLEAIWDVTPDLTAHIEAVHELNSFGAVITHVSHGTSPEGFDAEWRMIAIFTVEGDLISRCEMFDEADIDAAVARFEELRPQTRPLENTASRVAEHFSAHFSAGDWDAMAEILADNFCRDDRRRVVGAGVRLGRDHHLADMRSTADLWVPNPTSNVIATRGERLVLLRCHFLHRNQEPEAFLTELLLITEIDAAERIVVFVSFDPDDFDAAIEELDARYLAGEGAAHAQTWSVIAGAYAALNRHDLPPMTPGWANVDHRRLTTIEAAGDLTANIQAAWDQTPNATVYIEAVHRLGNLGAVVMRAINGTSQEGFDAEWREIDLLTVEGDLINRIELFDETDFDAALARFDELHSQSWRLENAASRADQRLMACVGTRDWDAMAEMLTDSYCVDDRRHAVNVGLLKGRDVAVASAREIAGLGIKVVLSGVIATRGERLVLSRLRWQWSGPDQPPDAFHTEVLNIVEINSDERIVGRIWLDVNEIDAAFEELDARYLAGEAAACAHSWSVITRGYAEFNQHEFSAPDWVNIDHRRARAFAAGELTAYMHATVDLAPNVTVYVEAVHRLNNLGAVVTHVVRGTSREGFDAEWREVLLLTIEGDVFNRCEVFDETDIDTAIARFEELESQAPRLENRASRLAKRFLEQFEARDWDAMAEILADNYSNDDRRRVVGAGVRHGRADQITSMRLLAEAGANLTLTVIATRGERLALTRMLSSNSDLRHGEFGIEMLGIVEVDTDDRITTQLLFDPDDIDAAIAEFDARYLTDEAAAHADTWSVIAGTFSALNRRELPPTAPGWVNVDHRRVTTTATGDLIPSLSATWDLMPDFAIHVEKNHQLTGFGAAFTYVARGTSQDGVEAEWREIAVLAVEGDLINRCELFDEADLDAALARFEELRPKPPGPRLETAASRAEDRFFTYFRARNWAALAELLAENSVIDDRHDTVTSAGFWDGRDAVIANLQALAEAAPTTWAVIATRGERLALTRISSPNRDQRQGQFSIEMLIVAEIDTDERIASQLSFDPDDIDAAYEELDARYQTGEAAAHGHTWSLVASRYAALNRHELPLDSINIDDHRRIGMVEPGDPTALLRAGWDLTPNFSIHIEAVHRLGGLGAVVTRTTNASSQDGFAAEWRAVDLWTVEGDRVTGCELFDETDVDAALARFEELQQKPRLENTASQVLERLQTYFTAGAWSTIAATLADNICTEDRRRVVNAGIRHGRDAEIESLQATADVGTTKVTSKLLATRGQRLILVKALLSAKDARPAPFYAEMLSVAEIDSDNRVAAVVVFDPDDIDAAYEELDARYLAGEAAECAQTWSVIAGLYAGFNRHELPATTPNWTYFDHRQLVRIKAKELSASIHVLWDQTSCISIYMESVHRLSDVGAVVTHTARGISHDDFDAEWRMIDVYTVEGNLISHLEMFDETDLDAALARFDELERPTSEL
ncbi:BTAD domain-containing putative transcriptional regulator [Mycobacterium sp. 1164966.3]|uniref:BTAD domain-containing putative transcriptional regulator n=1 Tax=Mycobacterium sp. 1164966.3 TaxID=1856861 RepID=UPI0021133C56|nr:BTAD domain-containing putative transcriptional regulator [Mycobacterium sp. 1164966.3]